MKRNTGKIQYFIVSMLFFGLAGVLLYFDDKVKYEPLSFAFGFIAQIIMLELVIVWMVSVNSRIVQNNIRHTLIAATVFLMFWLFIQYVKYNFFDYNDTVQRYLWYSFYIPQMAVPPMMLITSFYIGKPENGRIDRRWLLLFIPSTALLALIFSNDYHQLIFVFNEDFSNWHSGYGHGAVYFVLIVYEIGLIIASLIMIYCRCRVSACRRKSWIPFFILGIGIIFCTLSFLDSIKLYRIPELFCLTFVSVFESCIQIGLIPSNSRYGEFFNASGLSAVVVDKSRSIIFRSESPKEISDENVESCKNGIVYIDKDTRINSSPIHGGRVLWLEDISVINSINERISSAGEQLSEENEIIAAENRLKEEKTAVEAQTQIFNNITKIVKPQLDYSAKLLENLTSDNADFDKTVGFVCVLNAYVKRRSNLEIIGAKANIIGCEELEYSIRESLDYLELCGISSSFETKIEAGSEIMKVKLCYDFFEAAIEAALPTLSALMVILTAGANKLQLRVITEDAKSEAEKKTFSGYLQKQSGTINISRDNGTMYQTITFIKEAAL